MGKLSRLAGDTAIYGISSILGRLLNWLLVPLYARVFAPSEYGVVTELYAYIALFNVVYTFGLETTFFRFATKYADRAQEYFSISLGLILFNSAVFGGLLFAFSEEIAATFQYPGKGYLIRWSALILAFDAIAAIPFAQLRLQRKGKVFASLKLFNISLNISLNLFFILWLPANAMESSLYDPDLGPGYVFLSNVLANGTYMLIFLPQIFKVKFNLKGELIKPMLAYAAPLVLLQVAGVMNEMFSRQSIKYLLPEGFYPGFTNQEILGIFGACYKLSIFMTLAVQAFKFAFEPFFFSNSDGEDSKDLYAKAMTGFVIFGCFSLIGITMMLPEISDLVFAKGSDYSMAISVVPILLGAGLMLGIFFNLSVWYKLTDRTQYGAIISVGGAVITIVLNFILVPILGYTGSALASLFSWTAAVMVSYAWGRKFYEVPYELGRIIFYILFASTVTYWITSIHHELWSRYLYGVGIMALFAGIVYLLEFRNRGKMLINR